MPATPSKASAPLVLIWGDDDYSVRQAARRRMEEWTSNEPDVEQETIDASAGNADEALKSLGRLREALQTLPFFGSTKVVWFRDCNFLGDDRTASSQAVTSALADFNAELKNFNWQGVRLLISAAKVDKRRAFYKTLSKLGTVEAHSGWSVDDKNWASQAEACALAALQERGKEISRSALAELVVRVGQNARQLTSEVEKLCLYVGDRARIALEDVEAVCAHNKQARAFAFGDALGQRNLPEALKRLDEELWEVKHDRNRSAVGLLYGMISKVRTMILLKEMLREKWIEPTRDFSRFRNQLDRIPRDRFPEDRRYSPHGINPYVLFKALPHAARYQTRELVGAMDQLLQSNQRLVGSGLDASVVLQQALMGIMGVQTSPAPSSRGGTLR